MKAFAALFHAIDGTTKTNEKVKALVHYFDAASEEDKLWTIAILSHRRPKRAVTTTQLREWAAEMAAIPQWLFEETYHIVGDLAETIAKLIPDQSPSHVLETGLSEIIKDLKNLKGLEETEQKERITSFWKQFNGEERLVFNKLLTGGFRMGLSQKLMQRALAQHTGIEEEVIALRLMGNWTPDKTTFQQLVMEGNPEEDASRPYPFYLAYAKESGAETFEPLDDWQFEFKWDGIRGQLVKRSGHMHVWSRGEELVTDKYPEYEEIAKALPDGTVLDGEILAMENEKPLSFHLLQQRIGRKTISKKHLKDVPVHFMAYDLLELNGKDLRSESLVKRRAELENLVQGLSLERLHLSELQIPDSWSHAESLREQAREIGAEGLMIKRKNSSYKAGRVKGDWWKWKVDPLTIDAVMIYAMRGHGRRANLYTDYTFAVWQGEQLLPFAKAYSGLTDAEIKEVDAFVKKNSIDKFGPVRSVKAELVFELAFEGINRSTRHKSGIAVRFPRIKRWRKDKKAAEASSISDLMDLLPKQESSK